MNRTTTVAVEGTRRFEAAPEAVWAVAIRPESLAQTMPGVERVDVHDDTRWTAHVRLRLGFLKPRLALACAVEERREPEFALLVAHGESPTAGALTMRTSFELAGADGGTDMRWRAEVELAGRISAVGEKLLRPLVDRQVAKVMASLQEQIRAAAT